MGFRQEVRESLKNIEIRLDKIVEQLNTDNRLADQNKDLFDRLMAVNWERYAQLSPDMYNRSVGDHPTETVMSPTTTDEDLIGEIIDNEDLG